MVRNLFWQAIRAGLYLPFFWLIHRFSLPHTQNDARVTKFFTERGGQPTDLWVNDCSQWPAVAVALVPALATATASCQQCIEPQLGASMIAKPTNISYVWSQRFGLQNARMQGGFWSSAQVLHANPGPSRHRLLANRSAIELRRHFR